MLGYYYLIILNSITGIFFFGVMIALESIAIFCIFYTTVTVHCRIVEFKNELIKRLKEYINSVLGEEFENVEFGTLCIMDKFCDEVNEINDWPLNPASFKKKLQCHWDSNLLFRSQASRSIYLDFFAPLLRETINILSVKESLVYPWWQEAEWVGTSRFTMNKNAIGVIPPTFFLFGQIFLARHKEVYSYTKW